MKIVFLTRWKIFKNKKHSHIKLRSGKYYEIRNWHLVRTCTGKRGAKRRKEKERKRKEKVYFRPPLSRTWTVLLRPQGQQSVHDGTISIFFFQSQQLHLNFNAHGTVLLQLHALEVFQNLMWMLITFTLHCWTIDKKITHDLLDVEVLRWGKEREKKKKR